MGLVGCAAALRAEPGSAGSDGRSTSKNVKGTSPAARYRKEAAQAGHGRAQMRLAKIYDRGNASVRRDYAKALRWYEKARAQGLQVPRPHPYVSGR
jgi:TPR repeat protein